MFKPILMAGFFWATANVIPASPVGPPTVVAANIPSVAITVKAPVLMASAPAHERLPKARLAWELPIAPVSPDALTAEEQEFIVKVNAERTQRGLNALAVDPLLVRTARAHSREMCDLTYFNHHSPTPGMTSPMDRYLKAVRDQGSASPDSLLIGENIYYCSVFNDIYNVDYGHRALMDSPGHRANILEKRFTKIGLGIYRNDKGEFWVTQMFTRDTE